VAVLSTLSGAELDEVLRFASQESFQTVAYIPLILLPIFGWIWWSDRARTKATSRADEVEALAADA